MKITVLVDNSTFIDSYVLAEPALSILIEDGKSKILLDCGYSDVFIRNAYELGIDLRTIDYVVLSHSHLDHTWGLMELVKLFIQYRFTNSSTYKNPSLITHPKTFDATYESHVGQIGSLLSIDRVDSFFDITLTSSPLWISENLVFLGEIPRKFDFEITSPIGVKSDGTPDKLEDDSALVYVTPEGLVIVTGCAHAGICNIVSYAKKICNCEKVLDIIGGLHLLECSEERLKKTCEYLSSLKLKALHACHCTDLAAKIALSAVAPIKEVGSGLIITW